MAAARSPTKAATSEKESKADEQGTPAKQSKSRKGKGKENTPKSAKPSLQSGKSTGTSGNVKIGEQAVASSNDILGWEWTTLADSKVSNRAPVFTADGSHFFSIVGTSVRIYSAKSGKVISTLSASSSSSGSSVERLPSGEGHNDLITAAILNPENAYQLITASLDGTVKIWDYLDAVLLQTILVGQPILQMCAHDKHKGYVFIATSIQTEQAGKTTPNKADKGNSVIYRIATKAMEKGTSVEVQRPSEVVRIGKTRAAVSMAMSSSGSWLVAIAGVKAYVAMTSSLQTGFTKFISPEKLTCLAFHPSDDFFATGDEQGQIRLWYCLNNQLSFNTVGVEKRAQTTTMHWHAHAVSSIAFTANGSYLLSGGEESVLVIWQLQSGRKEFVPRLGSPIVNIAVGRGAQGKEEYLIGLSDGRIVTVDAASLSVSRSITRIRLDPDTLSNRSWRESLPLAYHKKSSTLILPSSHPSSLQIFSPSSAAVISELEVSPSNRVSRADEKPIQPAAVEHVAITVEGNWMATVDRRKSDDDFGAEIHLKIWHWESSNWVLNTRIDRPHGSSNIISMSFSPLDDSQEGILLQTAGLDGQIRLWCRRRLARNEEGFDEFWLARSSFSFRSEIPSDTCWSPDASLLAISYGPYVCLIDPESNLLLDCLSTTEIKEPYSVMFLGRSGRFLLLAGKKDIIIWDLVTRSVRWKYRAPAKIGRIFPHPKEEAFVLVIQPFTKKDSSIRPTHLFMFHVSSSTPTRIRSLPFRLRTLIWFSQSSYSFVGITPSWNVMVFGDDVRAAGDDNSPRHGIGGDSRKASRKTMFQDIFGKQAVLDDPTPSQTSTFSPINSTGGLKVTSILSGPSYLAPPLETLFSSLMDSLIVRSPKVELTDKERDEEEEEDDMAVDPPSLEGQKALGRSIDDSEVGELEALFSKQTITAPVKTGTNGTSNGTRYHQSTTNGIHSHNKLMHPLASNGASKHPQPKPAVSQPDSSPVSIGKKRKKSTS